jgi:adenine nucleotide transporter 17
MSARPPLTPFGSALAGALGAVFSNAYVSLFLAAATRLTQCRAVYPLDTVKTRLQALPAGVIEKPAPVPDHIEGSRKSPRTSSIVTRVPNALLRRLRKWQMLSMLIRILKTEGLTGAFKGFTANMLNTFSMRMSPS